MTDLDAVTLKRLVEGAKTAAQNAYAPYSKFRVGAAVLSEDGEIFKAGNVENASYGLTICAERSAVFQMIAHGKKRIRAIAIYTPTDTPSTPCGACRQVLNEFSSDMLVVCVSNGPEVIKKSLRDLFPDSFGPQQLRTAHEKG